ncbi:MAG: type IV secretory system conjugative DNA transfer family protein [Nitrospirota bacterium]
MPRQILETKKKVFGIKKEDRRLHMYILGRTGMGKTTLLLNMILNDIYSNEGVCFIDPHGDAVETLLDYIPSFRLKDVIYFNTADIDYPLSLNVLGEVEPQRKHILVSGLISIFRKLYHEYWQHRQEHILRNCILALLEHRGQKTFLEIYRMLSDWRFRKEIVEEIKDPIVKSFWQNEFPKYLYQFKGEALAPIQNKLGAFLTVPLVRNIVGQEKSKIDFREVIDKGKILFVNLAKGRIGEDISSFLGSLLITKIQLAAMSRVDVQENERRDFYLYVDEFQEFVASETFETILSEARKYRLCLILAHQYIGQLDEELRKAIFGNVGTIIAFPVGAENGEFLEKEFYPEFKRHDLIAHDKHHIYLKLAIDGKTSQPFSAFTLPPFYNYKSQKNKDEIILLSRSKFSIEKEAKEGNGNDL